MAQFKSLNVLGNVSVLGSVAANNAELNILNVNSEIVLKSGKSIKNSNGNYLIEDVNTGILFGDTKVPSLFRSVLAISAPSSSNSETYTTGTNGQVLTSNGESVYWGDLNLTQDEATPSAAGLMSAADKTKLDGIQASADAVSFTSKLTSGTEIGTITINGTATKIYCEKGGAVGEFLPLSGDGTMTGPIVTSVSSNSTRMLYENNRNSGIKYDYGGKEALIISSGTYNNSSIVFFTTGQLNMKDSTHNQWNSATPSMQIKNGTVGINKLHNADGVFSYNLDVNGSANATTLYENGTALSSKYVPLSGDSVINGSLKLTNLYTMGGLYYKDSTTTSGPVIQYINGKFSYGTAGYSSGTEAREIATKEDLGSYMKLTGNQTVAGAKTFSDGITIGSASGLNIEGTLQIKNGIFALKSATDTSYSKGKSGQVLTSNGSKVYWATPSSGGGVIEVSNTSSALSKYNLSQYLISFLVSYAGSSVVDTTRFHNFNASQYFWHHGLSYQEDADEYCKEYTMQITLGNNVFYIDNVTTYGKWIYGDDFAIEKVYLLPKS